MNIFDQTLAAEQVVSLNAALADFQAQSSENYIDAGYVSVGELIAAKNAASKYTFLSFENPLYVGGTVVLPEIAPLYSFIMLPTIKVAAYEAATVEQKNEIYRAVQDKWKEANETGADALTLIEEKIDEILAI